MASCNLGCQNYLKCVIKKEFSFVSTEQLLALMTFNHRVNWGGIWKFSVSVILLLVYCIFWLCWHDVTTLILHIIHSVIHSFIHLFVRSFIHSLICSFIHSVIPSFIHLFVRSFIHSFVCLFIHSLFFVYSFSQSFIHSFIHVFVRSFVHSFVRLFIHSLICSFIQSVIHSFICSFFRRFSHSFIQSVSHIHTFIHPLILKHILQYFFFKIKCFVQQEGDHLCLGWFVS